MLQEVERTGRPAVYRVLPDWLARPCQIGGQRLPLREVPELAEPLRRRLLAEGVERLFPVQAAVLPLLLRPAPLPPPDLCVSAPTGSGKTLAFVLPLVQMLRRPAVRQVRVLVVLPTQPLAAQVASVFRQYAGAHLQVRLLGADTLGRERRRLVAAGPRGWVSLADVVVSTPGRLMDHISGTRGFSLAHLRYLVIDEADRVMEMAEAGWLAAVESAADRGAPARRPAAAPATAAALCAPHVPLQKLLFSATLSQNPERLQRLRLFQPRLLVCGAETATAPGQFAGKFTTPALLRQWCVVVPEQLKPLLLHHLLRTRQWQRVLVFANSKEAAHRLTLLLTALASEAAAGEGGVAEFSGAVSAAGRRRALAALDAGQLQTLVCSDAMARGMDVQAVDAVVSYDIPALAKTYVHRTGRTARAGLPGEAVTVLLERQKAHFGRLLTEAGRAQQVPEVEAPLAELRPYEAAYSAALAAVAETVLGERQVQLDRLRTAPKHRADSSKKRRVRKKKLHNGIGVKVSNVDAE